MDFGTCGALYLPVAFSPAHTQSSSKEMREWRQLLSTPGCFSLIVLLLGTFVTNTCQSTPTWHHHSLPDSAGPLYSSFSPRSCQTLLGVPFLPPVSSTSQPSPAVLVQTDSTALGKAGCEPVCHAESQRAAQVERHLPRTSSWEWGKVLPWLLACTACTWVVMVLASALPRLEAIEEAKVMLMSLKRPCWGLIRCEFHLRGVNHKPAGLLLSAWWGWAQFLLKLPGLACWGTYLMITGWGEPKKTEKYPPEVLWPL